MKNSGFTIFIAMIITATLVLVATTIAAVAVREAFLSDAAVDSQYAFYAADTGTECALYWDLKDPQGFSAFATSTGSQIQCNANSPIDVGGSSQSSFELTFLPDSYCAEVT